VANSSGEQDQSGCTCASRARTSCGGMSLATRVRRRESASRLTAGAAHLSTCSLRCCALRMKKVLTFWICSINDERKRPSSCALPSV
jgi:hypothetical protein